MQIPGFGGVGGVRSGGGYHWGGRGGGCGGPGTGLIYIHIYIYMSKSILCIYIYKYIIHIDIYIYPSVITSSKCPYISATKNKKGASVGLWLSWALVPRPSKRSAKPKGARADTATARGKRWEKWGIFHGETMGKWWFTMGKWYFHEGFLHFFHDFHGETIGTWGFTQENAGFWWGFLLIYGWWIKKNSNFTKLGRPGRDIELVCWIKTQHFLNSSSGSTSSVSIRSQMGLRHIFINPFVGICIPPKNKKPWFSQGIFFHHSSLIAHTKW